MGCWNSNLKELSSTTSDDTRLTSSSADPCCVFHASDFFFPSHINITSVHNKIIKPTNTKMPPPTDRKQILEALRKVIDSGSAIVGAGAGKS